MKTLKHIGLIFALLSTTLAPKCSSNKKAELVAYAKDVLSAVTNAQPFVDQILRDKGKDPAKFDRLIPEAQKLIEALDKSDKVTALALLADLGPTIDAVAADLGARPDVLAVLAIGNIALHFIVNHLPAKQAAAISAPDSSIEILRRYQSARVWGCEYLPERCKAAK